MTVYRPQNSSGPSAIALDLSSQVTTLIRRGPATSFPTVTTTSNPANSTQPCSTWYTVQSGDYCYLVADRYNLTLSQLKAYNAPLDGDCSLAIGQILCVAVGGSSSSGLSRDAIIGIVISLVVAGVALFWFLLHWCRSRGQVRLRCEHCPKKKPEADFPEQITPRCTHGRAVCSKCLSAWIRQCAGTNQNFIVPCPVKTCPEELNHQDLHKHLTNEELDDLGLY